MSVMSRTKAREIALHLIFEMMFPHHLYIKKEPKLRHYRRSGS